MEKIADKEILANVIQALGMTKSKFAGSLNYKSLATVYNVLYGINSLSEEMTYKILDAFPQVNASYLTKGEGEILHRNEKGVAISPVDRKISETLAVYDRLGRIEVAQKEIQEKLDKTISLQEQILKHLINQ